MAKRVVTSPEEVAARREQVVALRGKGLTVAQCAKKLGLSTAQINYAIYAPNHGGVRSTPVGMHVTGTGVTAGVKLDTIRKILTFDSLPIDQRVKIVLDMI
jgi:orotate phosphoribosyltransferase-like protein